MCIYIYIGGIQHAALAVAPGCDDVLFLEVNGLMVWGLVWNVRTCILYTVYNCYSKQISWIVIFSSVYECGKPDVTYHPQNH